METEIIKKELLSKTTLLDGKHSIDCDEVFDIAKKLSISKIEVGKICNETGIRIRNCQLGCFS
jgi:hypothetical protein